MRHPVCAAALAAALFVSFLSLPARGAEILLEDDDGAVLRLNESAARVVTLAPHLAELMFEVGAGDALVGTVEWSDHPPAAKAVPRVGNGFHIDVERVVALKPDVVLAWGGGTPRNTIDRLRALDVPVAVLTPRDLDSIPRHLEWLGRLTGNETIAHERARAFTTTLATLRDEFSARDVVSVFYQISGQPIFTVGAGHTISELITICGGRNIFSDLDARAHAVSREAVITRNPEVIVAGRYAGSGDELDEWRRWENLAATRAGNLFSINAERIARPTSGILDGGRELCETLERARKNLAKPTSS